MQHIMIDLETLGTSSNAAIVSIGAVFFDPYKGEIGAQFEQNIDFDSALFHGKADGDTIKWWFHRSQEARDKIIDNAMSLSDAITELWDWIAQIEEPGERYVWGNGAYFDNVILNNAIVDVTGIPLWMLWNNRDVRTVVELGRTLLNFDPQKDMPFSGVRHSALADAIHQAKYVSAIIQKLKLSVEFDRAQSANSEVTA